VNDNASKLQDTSRRNYYFLNYLDKFSNGWSLTEILFVPIFFLNGS